MKSYEDCKKIIARKNGYGKLVMGHLVKHFDEAAELYASQFNIKIEQNVEKLIDDFIYEYQQDGMLPSMAKERMYKIINQVLRDNDK